MCFTFHFDTNTTQNGVRHEEMHRKPTIDALCYLGSNYIQIWATIKV